ncbi:hypothetical protein [Elizabethkingia anophelis]|uniref:Uncharacterized protein n=1 Tax=Elizabethkingia anophelis TaxID=1117645 RepID=A0A7Z7PVV9_9FLAO|nr:hypothetical protein [Elizabethkingia anophelis]STC98270.1 Uncharacterised protein [Elizabethkingia anophelis]
MEVLLNELSIHNQFDSFEDFRDTALLDIIQFLKFHIDGYISVLKKSDIYSRQVYNGIILQRVLTSPDTGRSDEIRKFKSQLFSIFSEPFWDVNSFCGEGSKYFYGDVIVNNSALAECYERKINLISLNPSEYIQNVINIKKDCFSEDLLNFTNIKSLVHHLYINKCVSFELFCRNYYAKTKINFTKINIRDSFELLSESDEKQFKSSFEMFSNTDWNNIIQQGGKGAAKTGLAYEKYHNQEYFKRKYSLSNENVIYKFRVTQKYRAFGFRKDDIFYILEFDLTHKLSD